MAAAWYLTHSTIPVDVTLVEASQRVGGVLETVYDGPYLVERSADNFATLIPDAIEFCQSTGYQNELITPNQEGRQAFVLNRGRILPIPVGFSLMQPTRIGPILTTKTLSWRGKARLIGEYFVRARKSEEDESLEQFATRRLGREAFDNLVEPIVSGIFTADPARLSMQATLPQFVAMEKKSGGLIRGHLAACRDNASAASKRASGARYDQFLAPRLGMCHWLQHILQQLPLECVQFDTRVRTVQIASQSISNHDRDAGRCLPRYVVETSRGPIACDAVILATPAHQTGEILRHSFSQIAEQLDEIPYASSAVFAVVLDRAEINSRIDGFGLIIPRVESRHALAISYTSNKYPGRVPAGQILLRIFLGGAMQPEILLRDDCELVEVGLREIREILQWRGSSPKWQALIRWNHAMPQYHIGHTQLMHKLNALLSATPNLYVCGAGYSGVGIPQCIRSGKQAAEHIIQLLSE